MNYLVKEAVKKFGITDIFFVDGGGDSLTLKSSDSSKHSEHTDPFQGGNRIRKFGCNCDLGDADLLGALYATEDIGANIYQGVIAVGLDIDENAFQENVKKLDERGAYYGRINMKTGEKDHYRLGSLISIFAIHKY